MIRGSLDMSNELNGPTFAFVVLAAFLEVGGDYLIRRGLPSGGYGLMIAGAVALAGYGFAVNLWWSGEFGKLLGLYVVVFFVVSQIWGVLIDGERLDLPRLAGGALIVAGGCVIQWWRLA